MSGRKRHVLLAWELGAAYGHIAPLRVLAQQLVQRGHHCSFAVRDLTVAESQLEPELGPVFQAPLREGAARHPVRTQVSYASLLNNTGFDEVEGLAGRIRAWRELMRLTRCDLVYVDHAPTALVAAYTLGLPAVTLGTGFMLPPQTTPFPCWDRGADVPAAVLERNEATVLERLNAALERLGVAALPRLQAPFEHAGRALLTYAELDHYAGRVGEPYLGIPDFAFGARPLWPEPRAPRLFAYLRTFKGLPALLQTLKDSKAHVLVRIGDGPASRLASYQRPNMVITDKAVHMRLAAETCDAVINYGAHGTAAEMLLAGKPGLLLPNTVEQHLVAARVLALGAALVPPAGKEIDPDWLSRAVQQLSDDPAPRLAAMRFAQRYRGLDRSTVIPAVAELGLRYF